MAARHTARITVTRPECRIADINLLSAAEPTRSVSYRACHRDAAYIVLIYRPFNTTAPGRGVAQGDDSPDSMAGTGAPLTLSEVFQAVYVGKAQPEDQGDPKKKRLFRFFVPLKATFVSIK